MAENCRDFEKSAFRVSTSIAAIGDLAQTVRMRLRAIIATGVVIGLCCLSAYLFWELKKEQFKNEVWKEDQPFVTLAFAQEGAPASGEGLRQFQKVFYPRVMRFPEEVCVRLGANPGWTDGGSIYCFDAKSRRLTRAYPVRP